jgi:hypothetical protein
LFETELVSIIAVRLRAAPSPYVADAGGFGVLLGQQEMDGAADHGRVVDGVNQVVKERIASPADRFRAGRFTGGSADQALTRVHEQESS